MRRDEYGLPIVQLDDESYGEQLIAMGTDLMEGLLHDTEPTLLQVMHYLEHGGFREDD